MNLDVLKDYVLMGTNESKDSFVSTLKTRCIQPTDKTVTVNGVEEKLFFNSENKTYFDRWMTVYRTCPGCGEIKPVSDFVTCTILPMQTYRHEGERLKRKEEVVCSDCIEEGNFIVPCKILNYADQVVGNYGSYYLYRNPDETIDDDYKTVEFGYRDNEGNFVHGFTTSNELAHHDRNHFLYRWNYETDSLEEFGYLFFQINNEIKVHIPNRNKPVYMLSEEVEAHPETWKKCSHCGEWFHHSLILENGMCNKCEAERYEVKIYSYHGWREETKFMHLDSEVVDENTLYLGLEIEVQGDRSNKNLVWPIADIFHLESDSSIRDGGFEMISQPMTLAYLKENIGRIKEVLNALSDAGMKSHDTSCCGLHIHTSYAAYNGKKALERAYSIVNVLREDIKLFARRAGNSYCYYNEDIDARMPEDAARRDLLTSSRYNAVNFTNIDNPRKRTVEFRMFRGTLKAETLLASAEFAVNIVKMANSSKSMVCFNDLLDGEYIPQYIEERKKTGATFNNSFVCFGILDLVNNTIAKAKDLLQHDQSIDVLIEAINSVTVSDSAEGAALAVSSD